MSKKTVVLAYSGGLDRSIISVEPIIKWHLNTRSCRLMETDE